MAVRRDLIIEAGSTERWSLVWRQPAPAGAPVGTEGPPHDLNSATARLQIRTRPNRGGSLLVDLSEHTGSGLALGGITGYITIELTPEQTGSIRVRRAFYDLFVTLASGEVHKVLAGKVKIEQNVTAPTTGITPAHLGSVTSPEGAKWS